jgi:hypothetical protein
MSHAWRQPFVDLRRRFAGDAEKHPKLRCVMAQTTQPDDDPSKLLEDAVSGLAWIGADYDPQNPMSESWTVLRASGDVIVVVDQRRRRRLRYSYSRS